MPIVPQWMAVLDRDFIAGAIREKLAKEGRTIVGDIELVVRPEKDEVVALIVVLPLPK